MQFLTDHPVLTELEDEHPAEAILEAVQDYASTLDRSPFQDSFLQNADLERALLTPLIAHMARGWGALPLTSEHTGGEIAIARMAAEQGLLTILEHQGMEYITLSPEGAQQMRDARKNFQIREQENNPLIRGAKTPLQYRAAEGYSRKTVQQ